jgi:DNA polymerase
VGGEARVERLIAWYEPELDILPLTAPFFARRFASLHWVILTPRRSAAWDGKELKIVDAVGTREDVPREDELDDLFRAYYAAIFNPARANGELFEHHVPARFRANMPETASVSALLRSAPDRTRRLTGRATSASHAWIPDAGDLGALARAVQSCAGCTIHERATQAVFGEGPRDARIVLVGEQPGDEEDLAGHPFVGPSGHVLDDALAAAGVARSQVYVTNAVKHFKWEPRGKRRLHSRPNPVEVHACRGWLEAELGIVKPEVIVCLGATAARALLGRTFRTSEHRGQALDGAPWSRRIVVTHHPAVILRVETERESEEARAALVSDLALARSLATGQQPHA